ncbi:hypothetical protein [Micromonospora zamorensis]|uniref:hypothetical protein n=1 Tax=Micromonospora zamorensis TaxID=709883 RepID=UPI0033A8ABCF
MPDSDAIVGATQRALDVDGPNYRGSPALGISTHWLRQVIHTWAGGHFGYGAARACTGQTDRREPAATTYVKPDLRALVTALAARTDQPQ